MLYKHCRYQNILKVLSCFSSLHLHEQRKQELLKAFATFLNMVTEKLGVFSIEFLSVATYSYDYYYLITWSEWVSDQTRQRAGEETGPSSAREYTEILVIYKLLKSCWTEQVLFSLRLVQKFYQLYFYCWVSFYLCLL